MSAALDSVYVYEGTETLRNRFDIRDPYKLRDVETDLVARRLTAMAYEPIHGDFSLKHLRSIHRELFQDVFDWAGEIRTTNISKRDTKFADRDVIEAQFAEVHGDLAAHDLTRGGTGQSEFASVAAEVFARVNAIHPFREGNGRTQEVYLWQLSRQAGYDLDWGRISKAELDDASIATNYGIYVPMLRMFDKAIVGPLAIDAPNLTPPKIATPRPKLGL